MMANDTSIAQDLLDIKAVQIRTENYFTWTSGLKSPIYCDNRLTMSYPHIRRKIVAAFVQQIKALNLQPDIIVGCATAGITHAAWLAEALDLPMAYVRSSPKAHGKGNKIEGEVKQDQKAIVIEDLISTGGSSIEDANVLKDVGVSVEYVFAIFTYGLQRAKDNFTSAGYPLFTISSFDELLNNLENEEKITEVEKNEILNWRNTLN